MGSAEFAHFGAHVGGAEMGGGELGETIVNVLGDAEGDVEAEELGCPLGGEVRVICGAEADGVVRD